MQWIFLILTIGVTLLVVTHFYTSLPKWKKVKFFICDQFSSGYDYATIKYTLMERYNLTPKQADLCLNNYQDDGWLQMQSFLEDNGK